METTLPPRATIGGAVPGAEYFTIQPVVRMESRGGAGLWLPLEEYPGDEAAGNYLAAVADDGAVGPPIVFPSWSAPPEYLLPRSRHGWRPAVRVAATGRKPIRWGGEYWVRARLEFCRDGEPSEFCAAFLLVK